MCVCLYMCICVYMYICVYVCVYMCICVCVYMCMCIYVCQCRAGLQLAQSRAIRKWNGSFCIGPAETLDRWREHFKGVLNVENLLNQTMIDNMQQFPLRSALSDPPCKGEILRALGSFQ